MQHEITYLRGYATALRYISFCGISVCGLCPGYVSLELCCMGNGTLLVEFLNIEIRWIDTPIGMFGTHTFP